MTALLERYFRYSFLGAFAVLRKATISFGMCLSVCPSFRMEQLGPHWTDLYEILFEYFFFDVEYIYGFV